MKTVIFGGTTEGRELSRHLAQMGAEVTVSVVSEYGAKQLGDDGGITIATGPRNPEQMGELIAGADLVIDATHPFALEASANINKACTDAGVRMVRVIRDGEGDLRENDAGRRILRAADREEAAALAKDLAEASGGANILLTTGVRDLSFYCERLGVSGTYARVLPSKESIEACLVAGLEPGNIIAMQGPFSTGMNEALIREFEIEIMITKESGRTGGFAEKLSACENCGILAIVISRPKEEGLGYEDVIRECRRIMSEE